jgi:hypothetical protein
MEPSGSQKKFARAAGAPRQRLSVVAILSALNVAAWLAFTAVLLAGDAPLPNQQPSLDLLGMALVCCFGLLVIFDLLCCFNGWKQHRWKALVPGLAFVASFMLSGIVLRHGGDWFLPNSPCWPRSFLAGKHRTELTKMAEQLTGHGFRSIELLPDQPGSIKMLAELPPQKVDPAIIARLRELGFKRISLDDPQAIVVFSFYHERRWFEYIWSKHGLLSPDAMPAQFTEADVNWPKLRALVREFRAFPDPESPFQLRGQSQSPRSMFVRNLDDGLIDSIAGFDPAQPLPEPTRAAVLAALNRQRLDFKSLLESSLVTYEPKSGS